MYKFKIFFPVIFAFLLISCGGGGDGGGEPNGAEAKLRIYPPIESISLPVGSSGSTGVEVRGGKGPYTVTTSDASVGVTLSPENVIYVAGNSDGTSEIAIYDTSLPVQIVKISVTAKAVPLLSSIGTTAGMAPSSSLSFTVRGGLAPYAVSSSDPSVATVSGSNAGYTVTSTAKGGTATINVLDKAGEVLAITVTVTIDPLVVSPAAVTGMVGSSGSLQISGGVAPYSVLSSNASVVTVSGTSYSLKGVGTATLSVTDAGGKSSSVSVTVTPDTSLKVAPATQNVSEESTSTVTYLISGGTAPYSFIMSTGDNDVATVSIDQTAKALKIDPGAIVPVTNPTGRCVVANRTVSVDLYDSALAKQTITLVINTAAGPLCP